MNLRTFALSTMLLLTSGSVSLAQLGQTSGGILARPALQGGVRSAAGITALPDGARVTLREKGGFVVGGSVRVPYSPPPAGRVLTAAETQAAQERASRAFRRAAELVGAATGFGDGLAGPFLEFLNRADVRARLPEGVKVAAPPYDLEVRVRAGALTVEVSAAQLPVTRLPATRNVLPPRSIVTPAVRPGSEPVVVRVFSDFQCPYCQQFEAQVMPALEAALPAGARLEFRHFPLESIHPVARPAAEASECAAQ